MKEVNTTPGKTYSVHTMKGCTIIEPDGWQKAIEAPDGYFDAHFGSVVIEGDDEASIKQLFKLAPYQKLRLLGVVGGNDGLPAGYHPVEYLENKTGSKAYVMTDVLLTETLETRIKLNCFSSSIARAFGFVQFSNKDNVAVGYQLICNGGTFSARMGEQVYYGGKKNEDNEFVMNATNGTVSLNGEVVMSGFSYTIKDGYTNEQLRIPVFDGKYIYDSLSGQSFVGRIYKVEFYDNGKLLARFMPAINDDGAPCLLDVVSKTAYYNEGEGDFSYPSESTTYSLRRVLPDWGKLTEHGLRRLYHAPAGYQGELYDYAIEHGYKPIVETEQPEEGYWTPRWTETADEIVLEWVETEPPMDEPLTETE